MTLAKARVIEAIHTVYSRYKPWEPKIEFGAPWHPPSYIPLDIESDLSHQVFANLVTRPRGDLLSKKKYTCQLHTEIALGWLANFRRGIKKNHETIKDWEKKKLDLVLVDVSKDFEESSSYIDPELGDNCRDITLIGAVEFKRNLWKKDGFEQVENDLDKLKIAADAMGKKKFWGILAVTNLWYQKIKGDKYRPKNLPEQFEGLSEKLREARGDGYDISLRAYHWHKAEALGNAGSAIITEESKKKDLVYCT